jgi:hypothetical protein
VSAGDQNDRCFAEPVQSRRVHQTIRRRFLVAAASAMLGYGVMNLVMTATPLAMQDFGFGFGETATVIQWHVLAMFAPSLCLRGDAIYLMMAPFIAVAFGLSFWLHGRVERNSRAVQPT